MTHLSRVRVEQHGATAGQVSAGDTMPSQLSVPGRAHLVGRAEPCRECRRQPEAKKASDTLSLSLFTLWIVGSSQTYLH